MSIIGSNILAGASGQAGGGGAYEIERSVRFSSSDSAYLSRTPASAGNRKTWTWAGWVKRSKLGTNQALFSAPQSGGYPNTGIIFNSSDQLRFFVQDASSNYIVQRVTSAVYRDVSAWMHIVVAADYANTQAKIYVNGSEVTAFATSTGPTNTDGLINASGTVHVIGQFSNTYYLDGSLADIHFIDSQALTPSAFGEFDTNGVWQPIEYAGSFGTNGFHLPFSNNSTAAALGTDTSSNGNTWTVNNLSVPSSPLTWTAVYVSGNNFTVPSPSDFANIVFSPNTSTSTTAIVANGDGTLHEVHLYPSTAITLGTTVLLAFGSGSVGDDTTNFGMSVEIDGVKVGQKAGSNYTSAGDYSSNFTGKVISQANPLKLTTRISGSYAAYVPGGNGVNPPLIRSDGVALLNTTPAGNDSLVDSPTNGSQVDTGAGGEVVGNYATLNPLKKGTSITLSNGNLDLVSSGSNGQAFSTIGVSSGKWYWEYTTNSTYAAVGIAEDYSAVINAPMGDNPGSWGYVSNGASSTKQAYPPASHTAYGSALAVGDVLGAALDLSNGTLTFYKNGSSMGTAFTGLDTSLTYFVVAGDSTSAGNPDGSINFGQRPFAYTAPSGFKALCTTNLPEPTIADGSTAMDVALYTGNGTTQTISGLNFSPDLVWTKERNQSLAWHFLMDQVRGGRYSLASNNTGAEVDRGTSNLTFNSDGFTVASSFTNPSSQPMVAWTWDAGSSTVTNTQGSITSQVRANVSAGFSVITYTGNGGSNVSVGHGLGVAPVLLIVKSRSTSVDWDVTYTFGDGSYDFMSLNTTAAKLDITGRNAPTSTLFYVNGGLSNVNGTTYVCYAFAPVAGYSSFGSYTGNGSADGPFVYTGFRPRWIMVRRTDTSTGAIWAIWDTARNTYNILGRALIANNANAEQSAYNAFDILSNGLKLRDADGSWNGSGGTYIYYAVAENPFQYARAR
jgi:hypothetical protein